MNTYNPVPDNNQVKTTREIDLELLALDLDSCTRCVGTLRNIETAIDTVESVLEITGTNINVRKILIESEEQAREHQFITSPTIRINNHDITFETLESKCDSCTDLCGCDEGTNCRIWKYQDQEYTEAPVELIIESLLAEIFGSREKTVSESDTYTQVPENLQQFFAGKTEQESAVVSECCSAEDQLSCCEPAEKEMCCETGETGVCGCR